MKPLKIKRFVMERTTIVISGLLTLALVFSLMFLEPVVTLAQSDVFNVTQVVTAELSFAASTSDVTMAGALAGITGGNATGTTQVVVLTNNTNGYAMDIAFSNTPAMRGNVSGDTGIRNYGSSTEPTYLFFGSTSAQFAYTVNSSSTADVDQSFKNNGTACNVGSTVTAANCWMGATSTSNFRIISRNSAATTTATSTILFKVNIPNNPSPAVSSDTYTATATLTLFLL